MEKTEKKTFQLDDKMTEIYMNMVTGEDSGNLGGLSPAQREISNRKQAELDEFIRRRDEGLQKEEKDS
ncbi:MAG: hypothetical protein FWG77_04885 [Treponema sp.]|nr:hypothetical protein [Treponema sp.]